MASLAARLEAKAASDLELAQSIASPESSGHRLAVAMYLGQQSFEKMLKSVIMVLYEGMALRGHGGVLSALGHAIYPSIAARLHGACVAGEDVPPAGTGGSPTPRTVVPYGPVTEFWRDLSKSDSLQEAAWSISVGAGRGVGALDCGGRGRPWAFPDSPLGARPALELLAPSPPPMAGAVGDGAAIAGMRAAHDALPHNRRRAGALGRLCEMGRLHLDSCPAAAGDPSRSLHARRHVLRLGLWAVMSHSAAYALSFPHSEFGRYPRTLGDDQPTAKLYRSGLDRLLYCLYVHLPCRMGELRAASACLRGLCGRGRDLEYWRRL